MGCARSEQPAAAGPAPESAAAQDVPQQTEPAPVSPVDQAELKDAASAPEVDAAVELPRPWGDDSTSIVVQGVDSDGPSRFEAERSELTAAQLQALQGLRRIPTPQGEPATHTTFYRIRISDRSGAVATYRAADGNFLNADEMDQTLPSIDVNTLEPFLDASHCASATESINYLLDAAASSPDAGVSWAQVPAVSSATPGCFNPIALPAECRDVQRRLQVETAGTYQLSISDCRGLPLALSVLSADGSAELAAAAGTGTECPALVWSFPEAGSYPLLMRKGAGADCAGSGVWGSVFLRVRSANPL